ncbi:hypothetical protein K469DRAFT_529862, partial [Zopfia rhizophila CBS 207.26]
NALSHLRTCHQIHAETKNLWMKYLLFDFNKLWALPKTTVSRTRHVRIPRHNAVLVRESYDCLMLHLEDDLRSAPDLRLDTLTILGSNFPHLEYETIQSLV